MARIRRTNNPNNSTSNDPEMGPPPQPPKPTTTLNTTSQIPKKRAGIHDENSNPAPDTSSQPTRRKRRKISAPKRATGDGPLSPSPSPAPSPAPKPAPPQPPPASARDSYRYRLTSGPPRLRIYDRDPTNDQQDKVRCDEDFHTMGDLSVVAAFAGVEMEHGGESWSCSNVEVHEGVDFDGDDDEDEDEDMNEDEGGNGDGKRNGNWNVYATGEPHHVCAVCREHALRYLQQARPSLFAHSALMGLCKKCADMAVAKHAGPAGYDGCICAERRGTWFCFGCRVRALETVLMWREAEDDRRRGIMRVEEAVEWGGDVFVEKTVWLGLRCRCGEEVEGRVRARRCAGCEGMVVEGRPEVG